MSQKIFITGSSDGLGLLAAKALTSRGHTVYLHGRNAQRSEDASRACPEAQGRVLTADLSSLEETKNLAQELVRLGPFDAIVHNAGLYRGVTGLTGKEGFPALFAVNVLAPYVLSCARIEGRPVAQRMVFLSSSLHHGGQAGFLIQKNNNEEPSRSVLTKLQDCSYGDSKLYNIMLANAFAKRYASLGTTCNALDPGWVPTKMGGAAASDDIDLAVETYLKLALEEGDAKGATQKFWYQCRQTSCKKEAIDEQAQEGLLAALKSISGVSATGP